MILKKFELHDINLWYFFSAILSLQFVLDGGFGSSFVRAIAFTKINPKNIEESYLNNWNIQEQRSIYDFMKRIYIKLFLISVFILITAGSLLMYEIINTSSNPSMGWLTWSGYVLFFPLVLFGNIYVNFLQGIHQISILRRWDTIFNLFNVISCVSVIIFFQNIYILLITHLFWLIAAVIRNRRLVNLIFVDKFFKKDASNPISASNNYKSTIVWPALKSGVGILMSLGTIQLSGFALNMFYSASEISSYMLGMTFITAIKNFSQAPFYSKIPMYNSYAKNNQFDLLKQNVKLNMKRVYSVYLIGFFLFAFFNEFFLSLLNSKSEFPSENLWYLLGLAFLVERYGGMHLQIYSTSNHIVWHQLNGFTGLLMITLTFLFIQFTDVGILSFPIAMILSYSMIYSPLSAIKSYNFMKETFFSFEKSTFLPAVISLIIYGIFIFF